MKPPPDLPFMPKWVTDSLADQLEQSAARIRRWAPESGEPAEMEELASELRGDAEEQA